MFEELADSSLEKKSLKEKRVNKYLFIFIHLQNIFHFILFYLESTECSEAVIRKSSK